MPSSNTKPLASRVSKDEYFMLLREAADRQMTISQFVKEVVINDYLAKLKKSNTPYLSAENGRKLQSPAGAGLKTYRLIGIDAKDEILYVFGEDGRGAFYQRSVGSDTYTLLPRNSRYSSDDVFGFEGRAYKVEDEKGNIQFYFYSHQFIGWNKCKAEIIVINRSSMYDTNIKNGRIIDFKL